MTEIEDLLQTECPQVSPVEEPDTNSFEIALAECIKQAQYSVVSPLAHAQVWKDALIKLVKAEEPVNEDLEEEIKRYYADWDEQPKYIQTARHFAKWQKQQMMKNVTYGEVVQCATYPYN